MHYLSESTLDQARKSGENRWSFSYYTMVCTEQSFFCKKQQPTIFYGAKLIFRSFATFFDQVPNKGFALLAAGQFETRLQEFGL